MALVKYGGGIIGMSGKIAGNVFAKNRYGNYVRSWSNPVNPNSAKQVAVRAAVAYLSQYWKSGLTAAQRVAWATYAASVAMKNRLGESVFLTGFNHFIRSNSIIQQMGEDIIPAGPTELSLPEQDATLAMVGSEASGELSMTFDSTRDWASENGAFMAIYMGQPQNATRNFFDGPWNYAGKIEGDSTTPPTSPAVMTAPFTITEGQKAWAYARIVRADGRVSSPFRCDANMGG